MSKPRILNVCCRIAVLKSAAVGKVPVDAVLVASFLNRIEPAIVLPLSN